MPKSTNEKTMAMISSSASSTRSKTLSFMREVPLSLASSVNGAGHMRYTPPALDPSGDTHVI